jgi:UDP-N-acetylglucosamine--N-acetylmuramyl-(pentapeptide) pyrophosphoryl-undecaprenol N-acetylglucosamine transferase
VPAREQGLAVLVVGGSQGARVFSEVLPAAIARLTDAERGRIALTQQCRPEDLARVRDAYAALGFAAELATFFDDLPARMTASHLIISRAGASSVAELLTLGRLRCRALRLAADDHGPTRTRKRARRLADRRGPPMPGNAGKIGGARSTAGVGGPARRSARAPDAAARCRGSAGAAAPASSDPAEARHEDLPSMRAASTSSGSAASA